MHTVAIHPTAQRPSASRAAMSIVARPSWRPCVTTGADRPFGSPAFAGFGFIGTGTTVAATTTGANHWTHKPYHQRPKEKLL